MTVTLMGPDSPVRFNNFAAEACTLEELYKEEETEVLDFLAARPIHTVFMAGLIRDNGMVSPHNRGSFYASRDLQGRLDGVALLGHATLVETRTDSSTPMFARLARNCQSTFLIHGERNTISEFWKHFASSGQQPRLIRSEDLLTLDKALPSSENVDLRPATLEDLDKVVAMNAAMALEEGGINPLLRDAAGFRQRTARRINQGRVWIWMRDGRLTFKADVIGATLEVNYLEGVYVHPEERRKGYGLRCLVQLSSILLTGTRTLCLTVNENNKKAAALYKKAGFRFDSHYETIYLR